jgi:hypothetical protein
MTKKKQPPPKRAPGRPKFEIDLAQLKELAAIGCTKKEIAAVLGCGLRTLHDRIQADETIREAYEGGKEEEKTRLRRLQWKHAEGSGSGAVNMTIHLSKHVLGQTDKAAIEMSGPGGNPIQVVLSKDDLDLI